MPLSLDPVAGRECGACDYCCQYLTIDTEEIQVQSGVLCKNCKHGVGCTIYETRPQVCRTYLCAWRMLPQFGENWRPDISGVLMSVIEENIPENYPKPGIEFLMIDPAKAIAKPEFIQFLVEAIDTRIPISLAMRGPIGHLPLCYFLNATLEDAVKQRDVATFIKGLHEILNRLKAGTFVRHVSKFAKETH